MLSYKLMRIAPLAIALMSLVKADDLTIYTDGGLAQGWEDWSWSSTIDFAATDIFTGTSSISVNSTQYAALSVKLEGTFPNYAGLTFDISGIEPDVSIIIQSTADNSQSPSIPLSAFGKSISASNFTTLLIDFNALPGTGTQLGNGTWDRITFQAGGNGAYYHVDNIGLVGSIIIAPQFLSAEPLANNIIAVTTVGAANLSTINVALNGRSLKIASEKTYVPVDTPYKSITYLSLVLPLSPGFLVITAGNAVFNHTLPTARYGRQVLVSTIAVVTSADNIAGSIIYSNSHPINPSIYGVNFPTSASYIQNLGIPLSRWGGNAVTAYNPFGGFTNAGSDWYFENRASDSADDWLGWVSGAGSGTFLTIPALDWVSKDASSYSYPKTVYPSQGKFDPYNSDAGNGLFPNGSYIEPVPDPRSAYVPWNTTAVKYWLSGLTNKPKIITIDNEMEIASSTHQDMHPNPMGYDEELSRVVAFSGAAKAAIPNVLVAAPSTCSWWFYWTSSIGYSDNAAHDNVDFIPWFLAQMKSQEKIAGKRLLDYLDIHYYFQADTSTNNATAKALRLRATRSLWDPSYVDESWVGSSPQNHQWNPTAVELIPRFKTLIDQIYPGTKLSISEWSSTNDADITGGLVTADVLGIFGKYKVDSAMYWSEPDELGPVGLAYWLYRGYGIHFGSSSAQVNLADPDPDILGVYAGTENDKRLTLVIVNKDPIAPVALNLANMPTGVYFVRHFGGAAGIAKWQANINLKSNDYIVVPPYTAAFLQQK